jgi:hypothetical protein
MQELREQLERVRSGDPVLRERAVREVLEARPEWVPAIYHHVNQIADNSNRETMKETLRKIRDQARDAVRQKMRKAGETGKVATPDYLQMVAEYAAPKDESWQALISVLAMSRMLVTVNSVEAARALIQTYVRFGEFLRVDTQLQLEAMAERALPALIEARKHPAKKIGSWAHRQLDQMGKAVPSEVVQTEDQHVLADALRAYGRIQDPDAARIIISFANSERAQVRLAARQGVRLMGEVGNWQLRETYQNIVGKTPPRDWSWKRTAQELFYEFDRLRLAQVHQLYDAGIAAQKKADWEAMRKAFDKVLAHNPMFDRRDEMADGYLAYAEAHDREKPAQALLALRRAERIVSKLDKQRVVESLRLTLEGEQLLKRNVADQTLFRRAIELDPRNLRAREGLAMIERGEREPAPEYSRYYGAAAIGISALAAILLIVLWRPKLQDVSSDAVAAQPASAEDTYPRDAASVAEPRATVQQVDQVDQVALASTSANADQPGASALAPVTTNDDITPEAGDRPSGPSDSREPRD